MLLQITAGVTTMRLKSRMRLGHVTCERYVQIVYIHTSLTVNVVLTERERERELKNAFLTDTKLL